jgi:3-methylcrotonyl-CoA carboxylase alpha subunit
MIAKLVAHGSTREIAIEELASLTRLTEIWPVRSNAPFLGNALEHDDFYDAKLTTSFIQDNEDALIPKIEPADAHWEMAARLYLDGVDETEREGMGAGLRLNAATRETVVLYHGSESRLLDRKDFKRDNAVLHYFTGETVAIFDEGLYFEFRKDIRGSGAASAADGAIIAPMPGKVIAVDVSEGQAVTAGQRLMVLEAMKMEHALTAPFDGRVEGLAVSAGGQVQVEAVLCRVVPAGE